MSVSERDRSGPFTAAMNEWTKAWKQKHHLLTLHRAYMWGRIFLNAPAARKSVAGQCKVSGVSLQAHALHISSSQHVPAALQMSEVIFQVSRSSLQEVISCLAIAQCDDAGDWFSSTAYLCPESETAAGSALTCSRWVWRCLYVCVLSSGNAVFGSEQVYVQINHVWTGSHRGVLLNTHETKRWPLPP